MSPVTRAPNARALRPVQRSPGRLVITPLGAGRFTVEVIQGTDAGKYSTHKYFSAKSQTPVGESAPSRA
jgi:hypothetical protein